MHPSRLMRIPGYTIIRELGRGGMATVYLARQDRLGRQVALKVMQPQAITGDDFASRFTKEGRIIAHLQHPQIVTIYDFDIAEGLHYFSMEYLPNGTLSDQIARGLSTEQAVDITRRIAQALSVAHDHGVIHRDIKPQNILFRADGTPVLTDFGIARAASAGAETTQLTSVGMVVGSPRYMSPEQSMSKPIDARSDLYSLGVVLYEMLTKELPYQADDVISLAMKHCSAPIPVLPGPLQAYQPIIEKLLAKRPEDRFGSTQELIRALDAFQTGQRTIPSPDEEEEATRILLHKRPPPTSEPVKSPTWRKRAKISIVALTLALSVAFGLFFLIPHTEKDPLELFADTMGLPPPDADRPDITERYERLALEHLRNNQLSRGLELVQLALQSSPGDRRLKTLEDWVARRVNADKLLRKATDKLDKRFFDESLALIEQGLELAPEHRGLKVLHEKVLQEQTKHNAALAQDLLKQAQAAYDQGDFATSMDLTIDGLVLDPENTQLKALQARLQDRLDRQRALREIVSKASTLLDEGQLTESLKEIERGLMSAGDAPEPELLDLRARILERIEREANENANKLLHSARQRLAEHAFDESLALIEQGLALAPHHPELMELRERVLREQAKHKAAQAAKLLKQAQAAFDKGDLAKGLRLCKEGLMYSRDDARLKALYTEIQKRIVEQEELTAIIAQAKSLIDQGQLGEAESIIEKVSKSAPENAELLKLQTRVKEERERKTIEEAAGLGEKARMLARLGNFEEALNSVEQALELRQGDPALTDLKARIKTQQAHFRAGSFFDQARDALAGRSLSEALDLTKKGLQEWPEHTELQKLQSQIRSEIEEQRAIAEAVEKARGLLRAQKFAESEKVLDGALGLFQQNAQLLSLRGEVERAKKQYEEDRAQEALKQASRSLELGDLDAAMEQVSKGLKQSPQHAGLLSMQQRIEEARTKRGRLAQHLPEMVAIKGGCFRMGSPGSEQSREPDERAHRVCIEDFELAKFETGYADFHRFVKAKGYKTDAERGTTGVSGCWALDLEADDPWAHHAWASWRKPNKYQDPDPNEPVVCVSKNDALHYIQWLNETSGQSFRLPTEAEWEYAARAATATTRYWGERTDRTACRNANVADAGHEWDDGFPCNDGYEWVAPRGRFAPNPWGLYDMLGNVSEWTCSRYAASYGGPETRCAPVDSRDPVALRGGAWNSGPAATRAAYRDRNYPEARYSFVGFRLARDVGAKKETPTR